MRRCSSTARASAPSPSGARSSSARASSRTRSSVSPGRTARRRRASCSGRCSALPAGLSRSPGTSAGRSRRSSAPSPRRVGRLRALLVPARGRRHAAPARRRPPQPRAGPPRPPRHVRGVRRREAPDVRAPERRRHRRPPARVRCRARRGGAASSSPPTTSSRPSRAFPARTTARTPPPRPRPHARQGLDDAAIAEALRTFEGVPHRIELVRELRGVRYVNDSKATNVAAALRALASFPEERLHVILGGRGKHEPYEPLAAAFKPGDVAYVIGESADEIARALVDAGVSVSALGHARRGSRRRRGGGCARRRRPALARVCELRPVPTTSRRAAMRSASSWRRCA